MRLEQFRSIVLDVPKALVEEVTRSPGARSDGEHASEAANGQTVDANGSQVINAVLNSGYGYAA